MLPKQRILLSVAVNFRPLSGDSQEMNEGKGLEKLLVWNKALELAVLVCRDILPALPDVEKYALTVQMQKSVQRIPANTAEGHGMHYYQDSIRFCYRARGSLEETRSHLILANKLGYLESDTFLTTEKSPAETPRFIKGYIRFLKNSTRADTEIPVSIKEEEVPYDLE